MRVVTYYEIEREEWRRLVRESRTGTWFQTPEAYDFFASQPELFQPFAFGVENNTHLRGVCCGYVTVESNALKQFFTRRAIIIGGPCFANDATDQEVFILMSGVVSMLKHPITCNPSPVTYTSPIYIETRNFNDYSKWKGAFEKAGFEYQSHLNFHVDCTDKEAMWERLSENRKRQIRRVRGLKVSGLEGATEFEIREWYGILERLYRTKVKMPLWPVEFFLEAHRQGVGKFLLAKHEGKVIGGSMVVSDERCVYEWFECGMNGEYKVQYPSVMATYAGMEYANECGCARYDMMGAGVPGVPYGVRDFKSEFGGELVEYGRFLYVNKGLLYRIGSLGVKILKKVG